MKDVGRRGRAGRSHQTDYQRGDALLFDLLSDWAPAEVTRHCILVEDPAVLYAFDRSL